MKGISMPPIVMLVPLVLLVIALCMTSCGDQQTELDSVPIQAEVAIAPLEVDSLAINAKKALLAYPALTDANCEQFLLDWAKNRPDRRYKLSTSMGEIALETFSDAPLHSANFQYKVKRGYYMPSEFVRIVPEFVVQGGNSEDSRAQEMRWLIGKHTLPAEFRSNRLHFRGALAMGRTYKGNPNKRSASYDFYLVVGRRVTRAELARVEREKGISYTEAQKERYVREGGTPHLDFEHTVFGQMVSGFEVLDLLAEVDTDASDWPLRRQEFRLEAVVDVKSTRDDFVN